ncbi:aldo/keto reductase [Streptomyces sp. NPDC048196]|uniref:aldo/keto reductase n=1 Tax=Streptomyces sp. NPDC048196 TaxID=3154712 RepID=UPI0034104E27
MRVSTKVGFPAPGAAAAVAAGVLPPEDAERGHSLTAGYVRWQLERNRAALGRACLDTVFLHNPERTSDRAVLPIVLREAFAVLEEAAAAGHLSTYGIATWTGCTEGLMTVEELDRLAVEAAGSPDHRLREVQLPVSLVEADVLECGRSRISPGVSSRNSPGSDVDPDCRYPRAASPSMLSGGGDWASTMSTVIPVSVQVSCSSPAAQQAAWPLVRVAYSPSGPLAHPWPSVTMRTCGTGATCRPRRPPGAKCRMFTAAAPLPP